MFVLKGSVVSFCESLFWKSGLSVFVWKSRGKCFFLEAWIVSFCESLVENARFEMWIVRFGEA